MGMKKTSDTIAISFGTLETAPNTFIEEEIALQLDVLNNEIFVVLAIDLNITPCDAINGVDTNTFSSISTTSLAATGVGTLSQSNVMAVARDSIRAAGFVNSGVGFSHVSAETYQGKLDYTALIATNNFFIQLVGQNNVNPKALNGRVWGYRAKADSSTYAALVQSEVLSA